MDKRPIGFLDSGVGGLTVVKEVLQQLPHEDVIFIGDEAHLPYGEKTPAQIIAFVQQLVAFLLTKNVKMIVFACNTATAVALPIIQQQVSVPIIGVIASGSDAAIKQTKSKKVAVIATQATVNQHAYAEQIQLLTPNVTVFELATPHFVPLVENGQYHSQKARQTIWHDLQPILQQTDIDTLILGCTHYPLLYPLIQQAVGSDVCLVDAGKETVATIKQHLLTNNLLNTTNLKAQYEFYTTGNAQQFTTITKDWLPISTGKIQSVQLDVKEPIL
ncbi:glutamate racemase [Bombilactobacillus thymidiniphilus]|uniref:Glutamate racemase n=1 Tax=Bombilactobacillus thymidiniphilus TaxID=2923363 RepID=A0ABY4PDZ7_9LACO|nr:glutamate racemase [Bombilactobacillus thymidiniphilus]UQS83888.1 glutamate racemase [Bombilactobacillus thymidiniphilus]